MSSDSNDPSPAVAGVVRYTPKFSEAWTLDKGCGGGSEGVNGSYLLCLAPIGER